MKITFTRIYLCCTIFFAFAGDTIADPGLKLGQAVQLATQHNKNLQEAQYNIDIAKSRLIQAGQWSNPSLNLANSDDRAFAHEGEYARSIEFTQEFPVSGRIAQQKNVARVDVAIAMAEFNDAKRKLSGEVASNFYALLIIDRRLQQLNRLLTINQKLMQVAHHRFHAAEVSELDANTAKLEYQRLLQEKHVLEGQRINQVALLNELLGRPASVPLIIDEKLPSLQPSENLVELENRALQWRPDFKMTWLTLNRAQADKLLAKAQRWADWTVGIGIETDKTVVEGAPPQKSDRKLALILSVPLPLLNTNSGRILEAGTAETQAMLKIQAVKLTIQTEIASNYKQMESLRTALQQSESSSIPLSNRNVRLAQQAYDSGQISLFDVVQAQRQQYDLQTAYLNTLDQYLQTLAKLNMAIGYHENAMLCSSQRTKGKCAPCNIYKNRLNG